MSSLPPELDFAKNRDASPERMNLAMEYIQSQLKALQSLKLDVDAALAELKGVGLERLDETLTPLLVDAEQKHDNIVALETALDTGTFRPDLLADAISGAIAASFGDPDQRAALIGDVIAAIASRQLYVKAGTGTAGVTLFAGPGVPDNALGQDGDLYVKGS